MGVLFAILLAATSADAADLTANGLRAYEDMDLDQARELLTRAQRAAPSRERPRVELWLGIVELERGNEAMARRWLRTALQGNPSLPVPASVSPKVRALVDELRPAPRATPATRLARRARPAAEPPRLAAAPALGVPQGSPVLPLASVSPHGGLAAEGTSPVPAVDAPAPGAELALPMPSPLVLAGAGAGAVAVGALGGGVLLGAMAQGAADAAVREARAVDATARYDEANATAWMANGLYAVGAVAAAVGVGCATMELAGVGE